MQDIRITFTAIKIENKIWIPLSKLEDAIIEQDTETEYWNIFLPYIGRYFIVKENPFELIEEALKKERR